MIKILHIFTLLWFASEGAAFAAAAADNDAGELPSAHPSKVGSEEKAGDLPQEAFVKVWYKVGPQVWGSRAPGNYYHHGKIEIYPYSSSAFPSFRDAPMSTLSFDQFVDEKGAHSQSPIPFSFQRVHIDMFDADLRCDDPESHYDMREVLYFPQFLRTVSAHMPPGATVTFRYDPQVILMGRAVSLQTCQALNARTVFSKHIRWEDFKALKAALNSPTIEGREHFKRLYGDDILSEELIEMVQAPWGELPDTPYYNQPRFNAIFEKAFIQKNASRIQTFFEGLGLGFQKSCQKPFEDPFQVLVDEFLEKRDISGTIHRSWTLTRTDLPKEKFTTPYPLYYIQRGSERSQDKVRAILPDAPGVIQEFSLEATEFATLQVPGNILAPASAAAQQ